MAAERFPDWKGRLRRRFRWSKMRMEWGRMCYVTNALGETLDQWWEWKSP